MSDSSQIQAFIASLPGRLVEVGFAATSFYQHRGFTFTVDAAEFLPNEKIFSITPRNQGPLELFDFNQVSLLTSDRLVITGSVNGTDETWVFRLEARDLEER